MKIFKIISSIIILSLILTSVSFSSNRKHVQNHVRQHQKPPKFDFSKLDLTEAQLAQIKSLEKEHHAITQPIHMKLTEKQRAIEQLKRNPDLNQSDLKLQYSELCNLKAEMDVQKDIFHVKLKTVLTDEQWAKFEEMRPPKPKIR
jgi:Spy/CpxP family protein refolding chaperone